MRRLCVLLLMVLPALSAGAQELDLERYGIYFEAPDRLVSGNAQFPEARSNGDLAVVTYQEVTRTGPETGTIHISLITSSDGRTWTPRRRVVGPIPFERESPPIIFSSQVTSDNRIVLAVSNSATDTQLLVSNNRGITFREIATISNETTAVAPRLSQRSDGGMLLFVSQSVGGIQSILYSTSDDLENWSDFRRLEEDPDLGLNFLPFHTSHGGNEYVVFQSFNPMAVAGGGAATYQLYLKSSSDGGESWSPATRITNFTLFGEDEPADSYDNQRPYLTSIGGNLALSWERRGAFGATQIVYAEIDEDGSPIAPPERITDSEAGASYPQIVFHAGETFVFWFNDPTGRSNVSVAARRGGLWPRVRLSGGSGSSTFVSPVALDDRLHVFWQNRVEDNPAAIVYLEPDQRVADVPVTPRSYLLGRRSAEEEVVYSWQPPEDPSGILGYNYVFSRNPNARVEEVIRYTSRTQEAVVEALGDGEWYFRIIARDRAGNWSSPTTIPYIRDLTPPPPVAFEEPPVDENGFLVSNTFTLDWREPEAPDVAGYSYSLRRIGPANQEAEAVEIAAAVPPIIVTETPEISRSNIDNGLYALSVAAIDTVGNVSETETILLRLNKYIPVTEVYDVAAGSRDVLGRQPIEVVGRGFTANGTIFEVILDQDGVPPFDFVFERQAGDFEVVDNRTIRGPLVSRVPTGDYVLGLNHPRRGLYVTSQRVSLVEAGHVAFGDYRTVAAPAVEWQPRNGFFLEAPSVLLWVTILLLAVVVVVSTQRVVGVVQEGRMLQLEARAIATGGLLPREERERRIEEMRRRGIGLRVKFTLFIVILLVSVILALALILGNAALQRQEETLGEALAERVQVLLESVSSQAAAPLLNPTQNRAALASLTDQREVMDEALYITITGQGVGTSDFGYVWATNDPVLLQDENPVNEPQVERSIDTPAVGDGGEAELMDPVTPRAEELAVALDERALEAVGNIPQEIVNITQQTVNLILNEGRSENDPEVRRLDNARSELVQRLNATLNEVGAIYESYPAFDPENLSTEQTEFIFYQPVLALRQGEAQPEGFFRGMVRIGISTDNILEQIADARRELLISTSLVAAGALVAGIIGALLLATIVVVPIRRLVEGVEKIRDTEDKAQLADHNIDLKTRDELSVLADTVNSMTQGLVKAAAASKDLTMGKEVQKMFIPLREDKGQKLTTSKEDTDSLEIAGYYEGAKGVSGDYFTYQRIDATHYALIKCDISGKGVSAALIMVQVATVYMSYFRNWQARGGKVDLTALVTQINDIVESMGFSGKFAALTVGILDTETGTVSLCNAGDTKAYIFHARQGALVDHDLPNAPAAGVFDSSMVPNGFQETSLRLEVGDILLLFTDGVEEAQRVVRREDYSPYILTSEAMERGDYPDWLENPLKEESIKRKEKGDLTEEFGLDRIREVVRAVASRGYYRLEKAGNPDPDEELLFDFSGIEATAESTSLALTAVEKVFRLYRTPSAGPDDRIRVDAALDDFLKQHFRQYHNYFGRRLPQGTDAFYREFSHVQEDEQYDDLTVLAIRKK